MCCTEVCVHISVEALRWIDGVFGWGKCKDRRLEYNLVKREEVTYYSNELQNNVIVNPRFHEGTDGWFGVGCSLSLESRHGSNNYCIAHGRKEERQGIAQEIGKRLDADGEYRVQAWVGMRGGDAEQGIVQATVKLERKTGGGVDEEYISLNSVTVTKGQWSLLTGVLRVSAGANNATLYLDGPIGGVDILVGSVAIVPASSRTVPSKEDETKKIDDLPIALDDTEPKDVAASPVKDGPEYEVNIIDNANLTDGLDHWYAMGNCTLTVKSGGPKVLGVTALKSYVHTKAPKLKGNYIYASNRTQTYEGPAQDITSDIQLFESYQIFAWVATTTPSHSALSLGAPQKVSLSLDVDGQWVQGGEVLAGSRWTEVSGSFRLETKAQNIVVYVQGPDVGVDVMLAGLTIFAVDRLGRVPLLQSQTDRIRKRDVVLKLQDRHGRPLPKGTTVIIDQTRNGFPMGTCLNHNSLTTDTVYRNFFLKHFNWAVFENELKWDQVEPDEGDDFYKEVDYMVQFCQSNDIRMRGHCVLWDVQADVPDWVQNLEGDDLIDAVQKRVIGLLKRYKGVFEHYDVNNEMLHGDFYEDKLGADFLPYLFKLAHDLDPHPALFVNDYNVENGSDCYSSPERYASDINFLVEKGAPVGGIGLQGHISVPVGPILCSAVDVLSRLKIPIWFTEVDVASLREDVRADDLEVLFREAFSHASVGGCVLWGFLDNAMARDDAQLLDEDSRLTVAGQRFLALKEEWTTNFEGQIDEHGELKFRGFLGNYTLAMPGRQFKKTFEITQGHGKSVVEITI